MNRIDLRLYALLDPKAAFGKPLDDLCADLVAGGATLLQLRDKTSSTRDMIARARELKAAIGAASEKGGPPLLINDRVDVALAVGADGVHLGQDDMPAAEARAILGDQAIVGVTARSAEEARAVPHEIVDYVAIGGVFATASKDNTTTPVGLSGLRDLAALVRARAPNMPICAIAGITAANAGEVISAGADGVAVISALSRAEDPAAEARRLRRVIDAALNKRGSS
jgi:thiamine-phosphate pyrophosphorylase